MFKMQRVIRKCPACGRKGPMEVVQGEYRVNWAVFWLLLVFTAGFGLVFVPLWYGRPTLDMCRECEATAPHR